MEFEISANFSLSKMNFDNSSINKILDKMIKHQETKVLKIGRELVPDITLDDIRNPQDFPELNKDAIFNYEDGILTGYLSVKIALSNTNKF